MCESCVRMQTRTAGVFGHNDMKSRDKYNTGESNLGVPREFATVQDPRPPDHAVTITTHKPLSPHTAIVSVLGTPTTQTTHTHQPSHTRRVRSFHLATPLLC